MDPLQVYPHARTYTFHNADEGIVPSISTASSISPYGLPYGESEVATSGSRCALLSLLAESKPNAPAAGKTSAADSTWPFPAPVHTGGFFGDGAQPWTW